MQCPGKSYLFLLTNYDRGKYSVRDTAVSLEEFLTYSEESMEHSTVLETPGD